jgi:hypothetical protein
VAYEYGDHQTKKYIDTGTLLIIIIALTITMSNSAAADNAWMLGITNLKGETTVIDYNQLTAMPSTTVEADLYCYGALVTSGQWTGVKISDLLNTINADLSASSIEFTAQDGYKIAIPMETAMRSDVIIAYALNSYPLMETLRLVIPDANGNMWISMITSMTLSYSGASNIISATSGYVINQNRDAQNTDPNAHPTQQTPTPTATPTLTPTDPPTPTPTIHVSPVQQTATQPVFPFELFYAAAVTVTLVLAGLLVIKHKKTRTNL